MNREQIYRALCRRQPSAWKFFRFILWGRINFNKLTEWKDFYQDPSPEELEQLTNRIPNIVNSALKLTDGSKSVLEVSAGFGNFIGKVNADKHRHATEFSPAAVAYLNSIGIETKSAMLPSLPYGDASFDIVATFSVFEHLPDEATVRASFKECHRICREGMIFSVPFGCMQPWNTLEHNFDFTKELILELTSPFFQMESWEVLEDGVSTRSISFLRKL